MSNENPIGKGFENVTGAVIGATAEGATNTAGGVVEIITDALGGKGGGGISGGGESFRGVGGKKQEESGFMTFSRGGGSSDTETKPEEPKEEEPQKEAPTVPAPEASK